MPAWLQIDTANFAPPDRAEYWRTSVCDQFVPLAVKPDAVVLHGRVAGGDIAETGVRRIRATRHVFERRAKDVRAGDPEVLQLLLVDRGGTRVEQDGRTAVAFVGALLLYSFLSLYGAWVLYGVAEEKSSRVAEVLLSAVRPTTLLTGKVIGIGLAALLQGLLTMGAALVATAVTGSDLLAAVSLADLFGLLGWFLLGYAFYAVVYAAAGSLVARQEDVQNVATPPALPLLAGYIVAAQAAFGGDNVLVRVMSLLPPTAPVVMPVRTTVSDVPVWEVALSVALTVAGIGVLVQVAGRVYARSLLRTGGRVRWRDALRSAPA